MADRIDVPLELEGFEVTGSEIVDGVLEVAVASTRRAVCHHCGSVSVKGHGRNERRIRDRACAYPAVLRWSQRRFRCTDCRRTSRERHPELAGRKAVTNRFRRVLFEGRSKSGVSAWLRGLPPQVTSGIEIVVMDMFWPYRHAVGETLPHARIVADKFHVLRAISEAAQKVRRRSGRRPYRQRLGRDGGSSRQHHPASDPEVFRARWVFMKRASRLTEAERSWLESVFDRTEPEVRAAWPLKEAFAAIYEAPDRVEAERRLDTWVHNLPAAGLTEFTNVGAPSAGGGNRSSPTSTIP